MGNGQGKKAKKGRKAEAVAVVAGADEAKRGDEKMRRAMEDERFAAARTDPRFRPMWRKEAKLAMESRFSGMLTDPMFASSEAPIYKRGRSRMKGARENPMLHYYLNQEEEGEKEKEKKEKERLVKEEEEELEEEEGQDEVESSSSDDEEEEDKDDDQAPPSYKEPDFETRALQHNRVKLSWDDDAPERKKVLRRKFNDDQLDELDMYLASDGSASDDDDVENHGDEFRPNDVAKGKLTRKERLALYYKEINLVRNKLMTKTWR